MEVFHHMKLLRPLALFVIVASRSINSVIWAVLLVVIVGPGVLAGMLAIALAMLGWFRRRGWV